MKLFQKSKKVKDKTDKNEGNFLILVLCAAITLFGVLMDFSASYYVSLSKFNDPFYYLKDAIMWFCIAWAIFIICSHINYRMFRMLSWIALGLSLILLGLIYTPLGYTLNNATRWLLIGPITIMPGEIAKTGLILFFAGYFSDKSKIHDIKGLALSAGIMIVCFLLIYKQPNLSTALIVVMLIAGMMFFAGLSWKLIIILGGAAIVIVVALIAGGFLNEYMMERIFSFLDPFADSLGSGYQVVQGLLAIGSGGFLGVGLGNSVQKAFYLPEPQSDFILAIIGEELGLLGILILMLAYLVLIYLIFKVAMNAKDRFGMLFAGGVGLHLGLQVLMNVAVVTSSMPATGVALPMVTLGGNSLVLFMAELGIVYNISKSTNERGAELVLAESLQ